jgi:hypothetical protein
MANIFAHDNRALSRSALEIKEQEGKVLPAAQAGDVDD